MTKGPINPLQYISHCQVMRLLRNCSVTSGFLVFRDSAWRPSFTLTVNHVSFSVTIFFQSSDLICDIIPYYRKLTLVLIKVLEINAT